MNRQARLKPVESGNDIYSRDKAKRSGDSPRVELGSHQSDCWEKCSFRMLGNSGNFSGVVYCLKQGEECHGSPSGKSAVGGKDADLLLQITWNLAWFGFPS